MKSKLSLFLIIFIMQIDGLSHSINFQDFSNIKYSIVGMEFYNQYDIIKIKLPNWLTHSEIKSQVNLLLFWPGKPPPKKKTTVFMFKETEDVLPQSNVNCIFEPDKKIKWNLENWIPETRMVVVPTELELEIYSTFNEKIVSSGATLRNKKLRLEIADKFNISPSKLDSIYLKVEFWLDAKKESKNK